jgi:protein-disulfide isomerase
MRRLDVQSLDDPGETVPRENHARIRRAHPPKEFMQFPRTMKSVGFWSSVAILVGGVMIGSTLGAQEHPWLDAQMKKQRYRCPPGKSPVRGPDDAQVTIVEFLDYDCPFCRGNESDLRRILTAYPTQVRLVFKNLPLEIHDAAKSKAVLANCMGEQGKFWEAHDALLAGDPPQKVRKDADQGKLKACIAQGGDGQVAADLALARNLGLATTPSFVVDGIRIGGAVHYNQLKLLIDAELARKSVNK